MPLIETIPVEQATGDLAELYQRSMGIRGKVTDGSLLLSSSPVVLKQQLDFIEYYLKHPTLSQELLACIRMLVSERNDCPYCINLNGTILTGMFGWKPEEVQATRKGGENARLPEKEKAMLLFVVRAVGDSHSPGPEDISRLKELGFGDGDILDALHHGARMSATDILFNAFQIGEGT